MQTPWGQRQLSLEFYPPRTDKGRLAFHGAVKKLQGLQPDFVSVTFGAGGSAREGTYETVDWLKANTSFDLVPHLSCLGVADGSIDQILEDYSQAGVSSIVALRGDLPPEGDTVLPGAFRHASDLVAHLRAKGGFKIYVACYPEFHPETRDPRQDMAHFAAKVEAGADVAVTQYFFDNEAYFRFVDDVRALGVKIPILVGLMPIVNFEQIARFSKVCDAGIPLWIRKRMEAYADDPASQRSLGIDLALKQAEQLLDRGCPGLHFYTLNQANTVQEIWRQLGVVPQKPAKSPALASAV